MSLSLADLLLGSSQKDNELVLDEDDNESVENGEENREDDNEEDEDNVRVIILSVSNTLYMYDCFYLDHGRGC